MIFGFSNYGINKKTFLSTSPQDVCKSSSLEAIDSLVLQNQPNLDQLFVFEHSRRLCSIDLLMERGLSLREAVRVSEPASLIQITQVPAFSHNFYQRSLA